jgi:hypothetical protein
VTNLPDYDGVVKLVESCDKYDIDYDIIVCAWKGFFTKINEAYKRSVQIKNKYDYILFVDAHDVCFVGDFDNIREYLECHLEYDCVFSTEKACWPASSLSGLYPENKSDWKYLNSGSYLFKIDRFIDIIESNMPDIHCDDQLYFTQLLLSGKMNCKLDTECRLFQSLAHDDGSSFDVVDGKFQNVKTETFPVVLHGNGKSNLIFKYYGL